MAKPESFLKAARRALTSLMSSRKPTTRRRKAGADDRRDSFGAAVDTRTVEIKPSRIRGMQLSYAPDRDGDPDAGEIVWTWVPYVENDGRGKDRPVLVIARHTADRVYAVKLTSRARDGDAGYVSIGSGAWDDSRRQSWVDLDQLYSVHVRGMRREAAALDRAQFDRVAAELQRRFGWRSAD